MLFMLLSLNLLGVKGHTICKTIESVSGGLVGKDLNASLPLLTESSYVEQFDLVLEGHVTNVDLAWLD